MNLLGDRLSLGCGILGDLAQVFEYDQEFVSPQTRDRVGLADAKSQPDRGFLQQEVAGLVAQRIVEVFEVVKIDKQESLFVPVAGAGG